MRIRNIVLRIEYDAHCSGFENTSDTSSIDATQRSDAHRSGFENVMIRLKAVRQHESLISTVVDLK